METGAVEGTRVRIPGGPFNEAHRRDAEPRDAGQVTGLTLISCCVLAGAVDHGDLLVQSHLAKQTIDSRATGDLRLLSG